MFIAISRRPQLRVFLSPPPLLHSLSYTLFQASIIDDVFPTHVTERLGQAMDSNLNLKMPGRDARPLDASRVSSSALAGSAVADQASLIADFYPEATVLFSDIVSFTSWSSSVPPEKVFEMLEVMFGTFDELARANDCYKGACPREGGGDRRWVPAIADNGDLERAILPYPYPSIPALSPFCAVETIGDAYVASCGCPYESDTHAEQIADQALDMMEAMDSIRAKTGVPTLRLRVGIHSGPITAGVIRAHNRRFQLFGDTMNTASRMESTGEPDCIQVIIRNPPPV